MISRCEFDIPRVGTFESCKIIQHTMTFTEEERSGSKRFQVSTPVKYSAARLISRRCRTRQAIDHPCAGANGATPQGRVAVFPSLYERSEKSNFLVSALQLNPHLQIQRSQQVCSAHENLLEKRSCSGGISFAESIFEEALWVNCSRRMLKSRSRIVKTS
jgi:hypothetical protein